jgi:carbon starvation protein
LYFGKYASVLFSLFIWLLFIYVIVVFMDLTAAAFVSRPELGEQNFGPGVATSSLLYLVLGVVMGIALYKWKWPLGRATIVFVPLIFVAIWAGQKIPIVFAGDAAAQQRAWNLIILAYCFIASVIPVWVLLQSRGYLGGFILYATFIVGIVGLLVGRHKIEFPAFGSLLPGNAPPLFPLLFTTIACGACSGFHSIIASGTTSKQIRLESDAKPVGYGAMLLEAMNIRE